jgi:hypothetical protein
MARVLSAVVLVEWRQFQGARFGIPTHLKLAVENEAGGFGDCSPEQSQESEVSGPARVRGAKGRAGLNLGWLVSISTRFPRFSIEACIGRGGGYQSARGFAHLTREQTKPLKRKSLLRCCCA